MNERGEIAIGLMLVLTIALCGWVANFKDVKHEKVITKMKVEQIVEDRK